MPQNAGPRGFTAVEVAIVMAIIGILAALAMSGGGILYGAHNSKAPSGLTLFALQADGKTIYTEEFASNVNHTAQELLRSEPLAGIDADIAFEPLLDANFAVLGFDVLRIDGSGNIQALFDWDGHTRFSDALFQTVATAGQFGAEIPARLDFWVTILRARGSTIFTAIVLTDAGAHLVRFALGEDGVARDTTVTPLAIQAADFAFTDVSFAPKGDAVTMVATGEVDGVPGLFDLVPGADETSVTPTLVVETKDSPSALALRVRLDALPDLPTEVALAMGLQVLRFELGANALGELEATQLAGIGFPGAANGVAFSGSVIAIDTAAQLAVHILDDEFQPLPAGEDFTTFTFPLPGSIEHVPLPVAVDIKPGSDTNSINLGSNGSVPVAVLSTPTFDAMTIDPMTLEMAGANVRLKGKGTPMASSQDVDHDGLDDLVVHVSTSALELSPGDTEALVTARTYDGTIIGGSDSVRIVPQ